MSDFFKRGTVNKYLEPQPEAAHLVTDLDWRQIFEHLNGTKDLPTRAGCAVPPLILDDVTIVHALANGVPPSGHTEYPDDYEVVCCYDCDGIEGEWILDDPGLPWIGIFELCANPTWWPSVVRSSKYLIVRAWYTSEEYSELQVVTHLGGSLDSLVAEALSDDDLTRLGIRVKRFTEKLSESYGFSASSMATFSDTPFERIRLEKLPEEAPPRQMDGVLPLGAVEPQEIGPLAEQLTEEANARVEKWKADERAKLEADLERIRRQMEDLG